MDLMPDVNNNYQRIINDITTVDNKKFDDILIPKDKLYNSKNIIKLLSDHFLIIIEIDY